MRFDLQKVWFSTQKLKWNFSRKTSYKLHSPTFDTNRVHKQTSLLVGVEKIIWNFNFVVFAQKYWESSLLRSSFLSYPLCDSFELLIVSQALMLTSPLTRQRAECVRDVNFQFTIFPVRFFPLSASIFIWILTPTFFFIISTHFFPFPRDWITLLLFKCLVVHSDWMLHCTNKN